MSSNALGKPDVQKREVMIIDYLREKPQGAVVSEIHANVSELLGDTISRQAYDKLLQRLVAAGKLEVVEGEPGARRYMVPPQLYATSRLTLDEVYELLPFVNSSESMARAIEAQQYFYENRKTVLRATAEALVEENAVNLFLLWIQTLVEELKASLGSYWWREEDGPHQGKRVLIDNAFERQVETQCDTLRAILYQQLSIPPEVLNIPEWDGPRGLRHNADIAIEYDAQELKRLLQVRIFGVGSKQTMLGLVTIDRQKRSVAKQDMVISGSDGSFHAGTVGIRTAQGYIEDDSFVVTFNNGVAYVRSSERMEKQYGEKKFVHSAPLTRQTVDDPAYKGMVLAPFMFPMLTDSEYEHMARTATDVVQMRVDENVFRGMAREVVTGTLIPEPQVHIRDGTITPQSRGFNHYYRMDPYGEITREGIKLLSEILKRIRSQRRPQIYAGAVKSTQIRLFSRLINWYIGRGSKITRGAAIAPEWDDRHAGFIADTDVMSVLLANLEPPAERNGFWVSCAVLRQFPSLTEFFAHQVGVRPKWLPVLQRLRNDALKRHEDYGGALPYHAMISEDALEDDPYLHLLESADFASFYIGHTAGDPAPKLPRYEFLCSLRELQTDPESSREIIERNIQQLVTALVTCEFTQDRDHNFLSRTNLTKLIPSVVYRAHEYAKHLGKKLEGEYRSIVIARLIARRKLQSDGDRGVDIRPISIRRYIERFVDARRALPPPERDNEER